MDIPPTASRGVLIRYATQFSPEETQTFTIVSREGDSSILIQWEKPSFYGTGEPGDYFSKYQAVTGELTKRKNGKWMFKGHQRLYARESVTFS